jgi:hypothetical protein
MGWDRADGTCWSEMMNSTCVCMWEVGCFFLMMVGQARPGQARGKEVKARGGGHFTSYLCVRTFTTVPSMCVCINSSELVLVETGRILVKLTDRHGPGTHDLIRQCVSGDLMHGM